MADGQRDWIDPEDGIRHLIAAKTDLTLEQIGTWPAGELPPLPYVSVEVLDGGASELTDDPVVEINGWFPSTKTAKVTMQAICDAILRYPRSVAVGERRFVVDNPGIVQRPTREDWAEDKVRRWSVLTQFSVRR